MNGPAILPGPIAVCVRNSPGLPKDDPRIERTMVEFLGRAYELKSLADYGTGVEANISVATATAAIETANRFVDCIAGVLG
jgi:hypothetical protein